MTEVAASSSNEQHPAAGKHSGESAKACNRLQPSAARWAWERKEATPWRVVGVDSGYLLDKDTMGITGIGMEKA